MKNIELRLSMVWLTILIMILSSCSPSVATETVDMELELVGETLFEGSNSLQYANKNQLSDLAATIGMDSRSLKSVVVSKALIELNELSRPITESLLLQVVSDNQELITIGTLNPLPEGKQFVLSLAENTSILPYLKDSGTTWVLDLNISEDYMDEMVVNGTLTLSIEYKPN